MPARRSSSRSSFIFALILLAVSVGLKFFEARRKKQVTRHAADRRGRAGASASPTC